MPLVIRVIVTPDSGLFLPTSFSELVQRKVVLPGLDPQWTHTLVGVEVSGDRCSADLVLHSSPPDVPGMVDGLRVEHGTPPAAIRVYSAEGELLTEGRYPAPLDVGQEIAVGNVHYLVSSVAWPGRNPETGACVGGVDWQHVTVSPPLPAVSSEPSPADEEE